jgi:hypothetical protein
MGWLKSTSPLKNAGKAGKRPSGGDRARAQIEEAIKNHETEVRGGLMYVKFKGEGWVSLEDIEKIKRIAGIE